MSIVQDRPKQSKVSTKHEVAVKSCKKEIDDNKVMRVFSASVYTQCGIEKWVEMVFGGASLYVGPPFIRQLSLTFM